MVSTVVVTAADGLAPMLVSFPTGEGVDAESREQAISRTATIQMMAKASLKVLSPMRIASNQMLLNFDCTRSPGRSSHEIGDSWTPSSERLAATHRWTWFVRTPDGALRLIDTLVGSPNNRYVKSFVEYSSASLLRPVLPAPSCECYLRR